MDQLINRLRLACRRGMLELDILLGDFFENQFIKLTSDQQNQFQEVLSCGDQELYRWFMAIEEPTNPKIAAMIKMILQYAQTKN